MSHITTTDAHDQHAAQFDPFPTVAYNPGAQYFADRLLWDAYNSAVLVAELRERERCREIVNSYVSAASGDARADLLSIVGKIQTPIALPKSQQKCAATRFGRKLG